MNLDATKARIRDARMAALVVDAAGCCPFAELALADAVSFLALAEAAVKRAEMLNARALAEGR